MKFDFSQLVEFYNNLNDQARYSVLVGAVFFVVLLDVLLLVLPQMGAIADINDKIKQLSDDTQQVLTDRGRINVLKKDLGEDRIQLKSLSDKVRTVQEVPSILSTVANIANETGVKIDQLVPEKNMQEALASADDGKYFSLPVVIKARCGYHKFGYFLNKLENEDLYFIMKDFIVQNNGVDTHTQLFSLTINMVLVDHTAAKAKKL